MWWLCPSERGRERSILTIFVRWFGHSQDETHIRKRFFREKHPSYEKIVVLIFLRKSCAIILCPQLLQYGSISAPLYRVGYPITKSPTLKVKRSNFRKNACKKTSWGVLYPKVYFSFLKISRNFGKCVNLWCVNLSHTTVYF